MTNSIVARDPDTGEMGVATQSQAFAEMLTELAATAPQFLEAARRFGKAGLMPADVVERILPAHP